MITISKEPNKIEVKMRCDICHHETKTTDVDIARFGNWISSNGITVHYFCLLLSTNLQQRGEICTKFLGFRLNDIRAEIRAAAQRKCCYCKKMQASIACSSCKEYFHITCGDQNHCLFIFQGEFKSYCDDCSLQILQAKDPYKDKSDRKVHHSCFICHEAIAEEYSPVKWISAPCCGKGYVHRICMLNYARTAGYYLTCIWCKAKSFREQIRMQGIFVPDCDASWEKQKDQYRDLHMSHKRCDIESCLCPRGRDYISGKWTIILCSLCGSFGAHNPICVSGNAKSKIKVNSFKCNTCVGTEMHTTVINQQKSNAIASPYVEKRIDTSMYMPKQSTAALQEAHNAEMPSFSDDGSVASTSSAITVIPKNRLSISLTESKKKSMPPPTDKSNVESKMNIIDLNTPSLSDDEILESAIIELIKSPLPFSLPVQDTEKASTSPSTDTSIDDADQTNMEALIPTQYTLSEPPGAASILTYSQIVESTSQDPAKEDFVVFETQEMDDDGNCVGTLKLRINLSEPRFANKTVEEIIQNSVDLLTIDDIIESSADRGIFSILDEIIAEYVE